MDITLVFLSGIYFKKVIRVLHWFGTRKFIHQVKVWL